MKKILVVDDEEEMREHLARFIARKGYETLTCASGKEALALFQEHKPDLTLLDIQLNDTNGIEVFKQMKSIDPNVRVCIITGNDDFISRDEAKKLGIKGMLFKPIDLKELITVMEKYA